MRQSLSYKSIEKRGGNETNYILHKLTPPDIKSNQIKQFYFNSEKYT